MVAIIALLAVLVITTIRSQILKGNDARRKADIARIQVAVEEYEKDNDCYPTTVVCGSFNQEVTPYLKVVPCDPITKLSYAYEPSGPACPVWYRIYADLQNEGDQDLTPYIGPGNAYSYWASSPNAPDPVPGSPPPQTPGPSGSPGGQADYWGCKSGVCSPLISQFECSPNYTTPACGSGCTGTDPNEECR